MVYHRGMTPCKRVCVIVGDKYIVADCGGGTVDLTVHQIEQPQGTLKELYKASGECRSGRCSQLNVSDWMLYYTTYCKFKK